LCTGVPYIRIGLHVMLCGPPRMSALWATAHVCGAQPIILLTYLLHPFLACSFLPSPLTLQGY
jgi:hypothetical protein